MTDDATFADDNACALLLLPSLAAAQSQDP